MNNLIQFFFMIKSKQFSNDGTHILYSNYLILNLELFPD